MVMRKPKRGFWDSYAMHWTFVYALSESAAKREGNKRFGELNERAFMKTPEAILVADKVVFRV